MTKEKFEKLLKDNKIELKDLPIAHHLKKMMDDGKLEEFIKLISKVKNKNENT